MPEPGPSSGGARRSTERGRDKRRLILEVTGELLAQRGYAGTTMEEIAAAAGTKAGSLYHHFESRDQLVEEVLLSGNRAAMEHTRAALAALPDDATAKRRLEVAIVAHVAFMLERSPAALASSRAVGQLPPHLAAPLHASFREYGADFAQLFQAAVDEGSLDPDVDLSAARMLVVGAANWTAEWFDADGAAMPAEIGELLCRMLFDGIGLGRRRTRRR